MITFWSSRGEWGFMSNFSPDPVVINGVVFRTTEHYYQCCKMRYAKDKAAVLKFASPKEAAEYARDPNHVMVDNWDELKNAVMLEVIRAKVAQHPIYAAKLLASGDEEIVEASPYDAYWGWGPNKDGRNQLGRTWMQVRAELREAARA